MPFRAAGRAGSAGDTPVLSRSMTWDSRVVSSLTRSMRASIAASRAAGQLGQHLGGALPGDQVVHDVPAGHPVQAGDDRGDLDRRRYGVGRPTSRLSGNVPGTIRA
jgi:hypothetical protein